MKKLFLLLMISTTCWGQDLLTKAHAHNDYEHERPFYEAFSLGFGSIEVDVYAINGQLLVAHDIKDIKASRTFQNLYLEPLVKVLESGKAGNYHQLLIDSNNLTPIDKGTLRNSGVATSETNKGILEWSTAYAKRWWFEKANFKEPNAVNKWGEVAWERNLDKYKAMYTKTWNSKK